MAVTPHEALTERLDEIIRKARAVSQVIEAARRAAIRKAEEEGQEEAEAARGAPAGRG